MSNEVGVYTGSQMAAYGFPGGHPFGSDRFAAFHQELVSQGLDQRVQTRDAPLATEAQILGFHEPAYLQRVTHLCEAGSGFLDVGDTPATTEIYQAALAVVGATLDATDRIMKGDMTRALVPIAGLHHAGRGHAAGFCVFNDCGIALEWLRATWNLRRILYVDIDVHHGDGVFYAFEDDADAGFADIHQDGRTLYPGTGHPWETGKGKAQGKKLNLSMMPGATDDDFRHAWDRVDHYVEAFKPEFILFQCGADGLEGDPIAGLAYTEESHRLAARRLRAHADRDCAGRLLAMGGGGYNRSNLARAWCAVVDAFCEPVTSL